MLLSDCEGGYVQARVCIVYLSDCVLTCGCACSRAKGAVAGKTAAGGTWAGIGEECERVVQELLAVGLQPSTEVQNILIRACVLA